MNGAIERVMGRHKGRHIKVMTIFGTRPEAVKMAPVVKALKSRPEDFEVIVTVTAQHREMLDQTLEHFGIVPDHDLNLMRERQSLTYIAVRALQGLEPLLTEERPDLVLVHGDTLTTFAASLASFYQKIPTGHVEAGLRTNDKYSPFPEEINRRLTGAIADLHFAPTQWSKDNLLREGIAPERIWVTGNTAIDALFLTVKKDHRFRQGFLNRLDRQKKLVLVDTLHRRENFGEPMEQIYSGVRRIAEECPEAEMVVLLHKNPEAREVGRRMLEGLPGIYLGESMDYPEWVNLMARAHVVVSDSGGIQEEAPSLGTPVLLLRDVTERPEAIEAGTVRMVGSDPGRLVDSVKLLLRDPAAHAAMAEASNPYGDGRAAERIVQAIKGFFSK